MCVKKPIAIKMMTGLALSAAWSIALAAPVVATVTNLAGPLMVQKADGSVKILAQKSSVEQGDTLVSERDTYAQITFIDKGELVLRPETTLKIDAYVFEEGRPQDDDARLTLLKGGVRWSTGVLAKRSREKFALATPTGSVGVRGTTFVAQYVAPTGGASGAPQPSASSPPGLPAGLYVSVIDGAINLSNKGGSQSFTAGQFGYTANVTNPPVVIPANPGIKFTPPPTFASNSPTGQNNQSKSAAVECEVR